MKKLFFCVLILMVFPCINIFAAELYGYIKALELNETTYDRIIFLDQNKPVRDENGNLITNPVKLKLGLYGGDFFSALITACANNWGVKLHVSALAENASINYLLTPYAMGAAPVNGLAAEYLFNGSAVDTGGKGNHGVLYGDIKSAAGQFNTPNSAFEFDGIDDYIEIPDTQSLRPENGSWSISLRFKTENKDQAVTILSKRQDASPFEQYSFGIGRDSHCGGAGKTLTFCYKDSVSDRSGITTVDAADGSWHHVVYVFNGQMNTVQIYIDNKPVSINMQYSSDAWPVINNPEPLVIGSTGSKYPQYKSYFKGIIENIRIYNIALTHNEVAALYNESGDSF